MVENKRLYIRNYRAKEINEVRTSGLKVMRVYNIQRRESQSKKAG